MPKDKRSQGFLHQTVAEVVNGEVAMDGVLITVTEVDLSPDLKQARISISVLPDKFYGQALERLRKKSKVIRTRLAKKLNWRMTPKIYWAIDNREKYVAELEEVFKQINEEE
jgi:ribosome-binding factor A